MFAVITFSACSKDCYRTICFNETEVIDIPTYKDPHGSIANQYKDLGYDCVCETDYFKQ